MQLLDAFVAGGAGGAAAAGCPTTGAHGVDVDAPPGTVVEGYLDARTVLGASTGG